MNLPTVRFSKFRLTSGRLANITTIVMWNRDFEDPYKTSSPQDHGKKYPEIAFRDIVFHLSLTGLCYCMIAFKCTATYHL